MNPASERRQDTDAPVTLLIPYPFNHNVPIVGAAKTAHLDGAVEGLGLRLDAAERAFLEAPYRPRDEINDQNPVRRSRALAP